METILKVVVVYEAMQQVNGKENVMVLLEKF